MWYCLWGSKQVSTSLRLVGGMHAKKTEKLPAHFYIDQGETTICPSLQSTILRKSLFL